MADVGHRCAVLVGPYLSGKTTLLEAMLHSSGTTARRGSVRDGNTVGDHAAEARARQMSTEINAADATYLGDKWTILDCPGSVELAYEAQQAMLAADVAVVVCEPEAERAVTVSALLRFLDRNNIPHMIFINKLDTAGARVRDVLAALQSFSERPLVLRQVPLRDGESGTTGYVDLVSERAYKYQPGKASDLIQLPADFWDREGQTRTELVEKLADFDDALLEKLLEDVQPSKEEIYEHLKKEVGAAQIVPVLVGVGAAGLRRAPAVEGAAPRHAGLGRRDGAARHRRLGRAAGASHQDLSPAAYRQAVAGRAFGAARSPKAPCSTARASPGWCASPARRTRRSPRPTPAKSSALPGWRRSPPARC